MKLYDFKVKKANWESVSLTEYEGKVILIVNTASKCGLTPQYEELEMLYQIYDKKKFTILGFPCNQFGNQEPGTNEDVQQFCKLNYGVTFPVFAKIDVNGENEDPLYTYLKDQKRWAFWRAIKWNFTKFLIDKKGNVVHRFAPTTKPMKIKRYIDNLI